MKVHANGIDISHTLTGPHRSPVVTFLHSLATHGVLWRKQKEMFSNEYQVLLVDLRGHGFTDAPEGAYTIDDLSRDVIALWDAIGIAQSHLVGMSLGGVVAQHIAASSANRVNKLLLCSTLYRVPTEGKQVWLDRASMATEKGMSHLVETTLDRWVSKEFVSAHPSEAAELRRMIHDTPGAGYAGCCRALSMLDLSEYHKNIVAPTLVIAGKDDLGTPVALAEDITRRIRGATLNIVESAVHLVNVEQPAQFNDSLKRFLSS